MSFEVIETQEQLSVTGLAAQAVRSILDRQMYRMLFMQLSSLLPWG